MIFEGKVVKKMTADQPFKVDPDWPAAQNEMLV